VLLLKGLEGNIIALPKDGRQGWEGPSEIGASFRDFNTGSTKEGREHRGRERGRKTASRFAPETMKKRSTKLSNCQVIFTKSTVRMGGRAVSDGEGRVYGGALQGVAKESGQYTRVAGCVIARQRPGTAKGFVFLSLEDETGISNVIVNPDLYEKYRVVINREKFLRVKGVLQNQDHTISIKASRVLPISISAAETQPHDFH
jgi:DNA polymerase III alpha subunit